MLKNKRKVWVIAILIVLGVVAFNFKYGVTGNQPPAPSKIYDELKVFTEAISIIQKNYVEEVDTKKLIYGAMQGLTRALDPYSQFMEPDLYKEIKVETEGEFGGLGIRIAIKDDILTVVAPIDGTPAYKMGILPGDKIVKIDGKETKGITLLEAVKQLRGPKGTKVTISIAREGAKDLTDYTITRDIIKIISVKSKVLEDNIGYLKIIDFTEKTNQEVEKALQELRSKNIQGLILDLRNNPGGLLNSCIEVSKKFISGGKLIVSIEGRNKEVNIQYKADKETSYPEWPLVALVNGGSASASEILTGAIQDHKRGIVLGTQTFGKASVQSVIPLGDGSALRLTTAKYFTPNGRSIHEKGITPDIVVEISKEDEQKLMMLSEGIPPEAIEGKEGKEVKESKEGKEEKEKVTPPKEVKDIQLERAIDILRSYKIMQKV